MGGIIRSTEWWWQYFKSLFHIKNYYISGTITVSAGFHELEIITDFKNPTGVFLSTEEPDDSISTCVGDLNWTGAKIHEGGFTLYANVKSNSCTIKYVVEYDSATTPNSPIVINL